MKPELVRAYVEVFGLMAIIGSLLLVAWEVSQNTEQMRFDAMTESIDRDIANFARLAESREMTELWTRCKKVGIPHLDDPVDQARCNSLFAIRLMSSATAYNGYLVVGDEKAADAAVARYVRDMQGDIGHDLFWEWVIQSGPSGGRFDDFERAVNSKLMRD